MSKEFEDKVLNFIDNTQKNFERMDEKFEKIDGKFEEMDSKFEEINDKLLTLSESVVLIEDKVMTEFPALFEAFELHQEMHKDYDDKNSYLSLKVEENSMRISVLEDQMKFIKTN